jgi:hypothetical protein
VGGTGRGLARILALEAVAATPTAVVLAAAPGLFPVLLLSAACLAAGYALLRVPGSRPIDEGAWLGVAIGGGIGLAQAEAAVVAAAAALAWVRPWLLSIVGCSGIGIALGFLARYDQQHRLLREHLRRAAAQRDPAGPHHFARLK